MRENSIIYRYSDFAQTQLLDEMYLTPPMDIISAFGCEFRDDHNFGVEEFAFADTNGNTGKLCIGTADKTLSILISIEQAEVIFLHDQYLKSLKINEKNNCLIIETKDSEITFTVWPNLSLRTTRQLRNMEVSGNT